MPKPIDSIASARILAQYQVVSSLGAGAPARGAKQPLRIVDTVQISQEAREKLQQFDQAERAYSNIKPRTILTNFFLKQNVTRS